MIVLWLAPAVGLLHEYVGGPAGSLAAAWSAICSSPTRFSSLASPGPGIGFARANGVTRMHLRGPATSATMVTCPPDTEYFGVDFRLGAYLPAFPPAGLIDFRDAIVPTLADGRLLLDGRAWEMPTAQNVDVFVERLVRAGLLVVDPRVGDLRDDMPARPAAARTAQARFVRAVGVSRRTHLVIARARDAARRLQAGAAIADVVLEAGYYDQPQLTRSLRRFIGHTPQEVRSGGVFLAL